MALSSRLWGTQRKVTSTLLRKETNNNLWFLGLAGLRHQQARRGGDGVRPSSRCKSPKSQNRCDSGHLSAWTIPSSRPFLQLQQLDTCQKEVYVESIDQIRVVYTSTVYSPCSTVAGGLPAHHQYHHICMRGRSGLHGPEKGTQHMAASLEAPSAFPGDGHRDGACEVCGSQSSSTHQHLALPWSPSLRNSYSSLEG